MYTVSVLLLWSVQPFPFSPLPLYLPPSIFHQHSVPILISSTFIDIMFYVIVDALSFSFPFLFPWVPYSSSSVTNMFYVWVCIWSCLFCVYVYLLDLSSTYERKMCPFTKKNFKTFYILRSAFLLIKFIDLSPCTQIRFYNIISVAI
jgi:hypothetical protein